MWLRGERAMDGRIKISIASDNEIGVTIPYNQSYIAKIKSIKGYRWPPEGKYWSFPQDNSIDSRDPWAYEHQDYRDIYPCE